MKTSSPNGYVRMSAKKFPLSIETEAKLFSWYILNFLLNLSLDILIDYISLKTAFSYVYDFFHFFFFWPWHSCYLFSSANVHASDSFVSFALGTKLSSSYIILPAICTTWLFACCMDNILIYYVHSHIQNIETPSTVQYMFFEMSSYHSRHVCFVLNMSTRM